MFTYFLTVFDGIVKEGDDLRKEPDGESGKAAKR